MGPVCPRPPDSPALSGFSCRKPHHQGQCLLHTNKDSATTPLSLRKLLLEIRQQAHLIYPMGKTLRIKSPNCWCQKVLTHTESLLQKHHRITLDWQGKRPAVPGGVCRRAGAHIREWKAKSHKQERHQMRKNGGHVPNDPRSAGHHLRGRASPGCRNQEQRGTESHHTQRMAPNSKHGKPCRTRDLLSFLTN